MKNVPNAPECYNTQARLDTIRAAHIIEKMDGGFGQTDPPGWKDNESAEGSSSSSKCGAGHCISYSHGEDGNMRLENYRRFRVLCGACPMRFHSPKDHLRHADTHERQALFCTEPTCAQETGGPTFEALSYQWGSGKDHSQRTTSSRFMRAHLRWFKLFLNKKLPGGRPISGMSPTSWSTRLRLDQYYGQKLDLEQQAEGMRHLAHHLNEANAAEVLASLGEGSHNLLWSSENDESWWRRLRVFQKFVLATMDIGGLVSCALSSVAINNHHDVLAKSLDGNGNDHCGGTLISLPKKLLELLMVREHCSAITSHDLTSLQLNELEPGEAANILLLIALAGHGVGTAIMSRNVKGAKAWLVAGVVTAFGAGLLTKCPFHAATLDFMPWTILTAALLGMFLTTQRGRKDNFRRHENDESEKCVTCKHYVCDCKTEDKGY